jgi:hypothetical protein
MSPPRPLVALCAQLAVGADCDSWSFAFHPRLELNGETVVPDVAGWRAPEPHGAPDWVCDLAPHGETKTYARHGIRSVWRIDEESRVVDVMQRAGSGWYYDSYDRHLSAQPFEGVNIDVRALWLR